MRDRNQAGWPDYVGLGTVKSGTTWLHKCICEHPQSFMPSLKEIQYFDENFSLGEDWYLNFFRSAKKRITGEFSPRYLSDSRVLPRLDVLPENVRFIVSFRNPVDRAYSHYQMDMRDAEGMSDSDKVRKFDDIVFRPDVEYLRMGLYDEQLLPYLERFGRERFHFVLFDDISDRPKDVVRDLYTFLGLDESFLPAGVVVPSNPSVKYKSVFVFNTAQRLVRIAEKVGLRKFIFWLKINGVRDSVLRRLEAEHAYQPMTATTRRRLVEYFRPSVERLEQLTGKEMSSWYLPR